MKRCRATIDDIASLTNLTQAFAAAAKGKHGRPDVERYRASLFGNLSHLQDDLLAGAPHLPPLHSFAIRDPKPRMIHAPAFPERVLHHAVVNVIGPRLEASLIDQTFACRHGKGALAAVRQCQSRLRRSSWYGQIDIARYFPSIRHDFLLDLLSKRFSDHDVLRLLDLLVRRHEDAPGTGLPIGALTLQVFANAYLGSADRVLTDHPASRGAVRYMDDLVWWADDRADARRVLDAVVAHIEGNLGLAVKRPMKIAPSHAGLQFCGYRIFADRLLLSRRRKRRYKEARRRAETAYANGEIDATMLQQRMDQVIAITAHADAIEWRRAELRRRPPCAMVANA